MGAGIINSSFIFTDVTQYWTALQGFKNIQVENTDTSTPLTILGATYAAHPGAYVIEAYGDYLNTCGGINVTNHGDLSVLNTTTGAIVIAPENCGAGNWATLAPISAMAANANWLMPATDANIAAYNIAQTWTAAQTMTLTTPTIASFTNATHNHQNAAGGGTLDAAAVASGVFTADRVYQSVVHLAADQSTTSATFADVTGLTLPVAASSYYEFEFNLCCKTANTADYPQFKILGPASPTRVSYEIVAYDAAGGTNSFIPANAFGVVMGQPLTSIGNGNFLRFKGILANGANAGNVKLQFANTAGSVSVSIQTGSMAKLTKLP